MTPLLALQKMGQSVWLDYIRRSLITSGELKRLVELDGLRGVTINPTILEKAIIGSSDYDSAIRAQLAAEVQTDGPRLYEALAIEDTQLAADVLRPVYDVTEGADGFVSLEVSPYLAHDTAGTIAEARRFWEAVARPNVMIKVPGTPEGVPAVEALTAEGINVNITLLFSLAAYEAVAQAYIRGLTRSPRPARLASVASFFVSRVDTAVDHALEASGPEGLALQGRVAIAQAKVAYGRFRQIFYGEPFAVLSQKGARVQRLLWASTGTKNPAYSDVLYVEELIGPDTVNTMPPATLAAFRDHGRVRPTLGEHVEEAQAALARLREVGVDLDAITAGLLADGITAFEASYKKLVRALEDKRQAILTEQVDTQQFALGVHQARVEARLGTWTSANFCRRMWSKDPTLWALKPVPELVDRMGWLGLPETMHEQLAELQRFAGQVQMEGIRHLVLLGMGGSSLAPEVFQRTFGNAPGYPTLVILDSTHPAAVRAIEAKVDLRRTLFLVSSKSGTTLEPLSFFRYFWQRASQVVAVPGQHFVAITDRATPLERLAREREFRRVFLAPPDVGGRYSALTVFGLVPAALIGMSIHRLVDQAWTMAESCAFCVAERENPGVVLGAALGELALAGRDKLTVFASPSLAAFPDWLEQLVAESTGKDGKGILPVADEPVGLPSSYGVDRVFAYLQLKGDDASAIDERISALERASHPLVRLRLAEKADLGQEFFRWEVAVAAAGAVLGINPFNQPDVELAKELARKAMAPKDAPHDGAAAQVRIGDRKALSRTLSSWLAGVRPDDYLALQAYLAPTPATQASLQNIRVMLRDRLHLATTLGFGPRFLHSTGQLHKGGANTGRFLQLVDEPARDLAIPETDYTFGALIRAQAVGDYQALRQRDRKVFTVNLGQDVPAGLAALAEALRG